jgi:hypothetical protein
MKNNELGEFIETYKAKNTIAEAIQLVLDGETRNW